MLKRSEEKEISEIKEKLAALEKTINKIQMEVEISMDARVGYLETKLTDAKRLKPTIENLTKEIELLSERFQQKFPKRDDDQLDMQYV